jgi:hypothetical protein
MSYHIMNKTEKLNLPMLFFSILSLSLLCVWWNMIYTMNY